MDSADDLRRALEGRKPGDTIEVDLERDGHPLKVTVTLDDQPAGRIDG